MADKSASRSFAGGLNLVFFDGVSDGRRGESLFVIGSPVDVRATERSRT